MKNKKIILILLIILSTIFIFKLNSNQVKDNKMMHIEMYYVDKYQPIKELINDSKFSNEASHKKYYAKHANEIKPSALNYIEYSKNLNYSNIYYYELCLFF